MSHRVVSGSDPSMPFDQRSFRPVRPIEAPPLEASVSDFGGAPEPGQQARRVRVPPVPTLVDEVREPEPTRSFDPSIDAETIRLLTEGVERQRAAGFTGYDPRFAYVVDPSKQELMVIDWSSGAVADRFPAGTGSRGLGFGGAQTPVGFFTMGGVRIARGASAYIQTGDSRAGVSGVYAEMLYPPSHPDRDLRGRVPNNVIIHGFNPSVSQMLRDRHRQGMIGRIPCTTGCPVLNMDDLPEFSRYLRESAGVFDPGARPNSDLRRLIRTKQVVEYSKPSGLGDPILILNRPFRG